MLNASITLTLGDRLYDKHCVAMRLRRTQLSALDRLELLLPASATFEAVPGDDCLMKMNGGEGNTPVFSGKITQVRRSFSGLFIEAHNGGFALARYRPAVAFEQQRIGDVIGNLCADADVEIASNVDGPVMALYAADGRATAAQEIARLAFMAGASGAFDEEGRLHVSEDGGPSGELALKYGREIMAGDTANSLADETSVTVVGEGGGAPDSGQARWIIVDFLSGGGSEPGPDARRLVRPELRTQEDAELAAAAFAQRRAAGESQVRLRTWLHPGLHPGMRIEFDSMPESMPLQECRVRQVISEALPGKAMTTDVWATGQVGGASDFSGLASALGGLL